jgi:hypothetical protein
VTISEMRSPAVWHWAASTGLKYSDSTALLTFGSFDAFVLGGMENASTGSGLSQTQNPWHLIFRPLNPCRFKTKTAVRCSLKRTNLWTIMLPLHLILPRPLSLPLLLAVCHQHWPYLHNTHSLSIVAIVRLINPWWWHYYSPLKCGSCFHSATPQMTGILVPLLW